MCCDSWGRKESDTTKRLISSVLLIMGTLHVILRFQTEDSSLWHTTHSTSVQACIVVRVFLTKCFLQFNPLWGCSRLPSNLAYAVSPSSLSQSQPIVSEPCWGPTCWGTILEVSSSSRMLSLTISIKPSLASLNSQHPLYL